SSRPNSKGLRGAGGRALAMSQSRVRSVTQYGLRIMRNTSSGFGPRRASWGMRSKLLMGLVLLAGCRGTPGKTAPRTYVPHLIPQESGTRLRLQAVSVVDDKVVWASGAGGTYVRTIDGGNTWTAGRVNGADSLEFRDVYAVDEKTAWLLSAGTGDRSRIYKT